MLQAQLNNEKAVLKELEKVYKKAIEDIDEKIAALLGRSDADLSHVIYQVEYQRQLKTQIQAALEQLQAQEFETISSFLTDCYEDGFVSALYSMQQQGIPLIFPIDQSQVVAAIQTESKISEGLYTRLSKDIGELKKTISSELSRGIATSMPYSQIAKNLNRAADIGLHRAMRITRTEGGRIQNKAAMDAMYKAKDNGADIMKRWSAALDARTRDSHVKVDGEIRELDKPFSNKLMYPKDPSGTASEVVNCRCRVQQKARWALEADETKMLGDTSQMSEAQRKAIAKKLGIPEKDLDKYSKQIVPVNAKSYADFKQKYNELWHYEGSDLQKQAEARIASYKTKRTKGLAAKVGSDDVPYHEEHRFVKSIDVTNHATVYKELIDFENVAKTKPIETACVITKTGKVYNCFGVKDRVFPDFDLKNEIKGAIITHNHPESETVYTFSNADLTMFMDYNLEILRGCDTKYVYEFTRNANDIDEIPDLDIGIADLTPENYFHYDMIMKAKNYGIGYRRWKND